jgi:tetratricopeptide (TPR) repeat protein
MKIITPLLSLVLGSILLLPAAHARSDRDGMRGGGSGNKRSPMTGSKIERPSSRPAPKPVGRPMSRPESRPMPRPSVQRPETRPAPRPETRPSVQRPETRPAPRPELTRPAPRPETRPSVQRPETRPAQRPELTRPTQRPETLPGKLPDRRPDTRPSLERPGHTRPNTLPGMVTYPNRPDKRPNISRDNIQINQVNVGRKNQGLNRPATLQANRRQDWDNKRWDNKRWGGNRGVWGNDVNVTINNKFKYNNNYSYRPNYWGARPWWGAGSSHYWHHGHWGYGWNSSYYRRHWYYNDNDFASGFMWGIAVWSLGNLIYDMGYQSYRNPYPAPPVQNTYITYTQPVSVAAAANPPGDEKVVEIAETKSAEALERSRTAFKNRDYLAASKAVDEALAHTPEDVTLHEYRALIFFALGKYPEAAGVLNPVLASGPGWGWDTMVGFYDNSGTYSEQLRKLEDYSRNAPDKADARFLLGYHYMVCGHMEKANEQFAKAAELEAGDSISRQLRDLTAASIPDGGQSDDSAAEPPPAPAPVNPDQLVGTWVSDRGADGKVTFVMAESGDYTWSFMNAGQNSELKGTYGLDEKGLLVLTSDDSQMVSAVELKDGQKMHFVLIGAPDGDPGLDFVKK